MVGTVLLFSGCFLALTGAVGVLRMPDFYTRIHPAGKADTLAQSLIVLGLLIGRSHEFVTAVKLVMVTGLLYFTAPTATHAITQATYRSDDELEKRWPRTSANPSKQEGTPNE
ncbi:MAG: monovalent cation/H(+) antiporter subunit G [Planctomycetes bacterium]|nr:monovalent cation/H(+) antiporter subunit G [Planctomycetota bacterium]